jgi:hypothetical protein
MDRFTRSLLLSAALLAAAAGMPRDARAGEIVGGSPSCELAATAAHPCAWKASSHCKRPGVPMIYVATAAEYNQAAEALNIYVGGINAYMTCLSSEAQTDMNSAAQMVKTSVDKAQASVTDEFNRTKAQLDAARLKLQLK